MTRGGSAPPAAPPRNAPMPSRRHSARPWTRTVSFRSRATRTAPLAGSLGPRAFAGVLAGARRRAHPLGLLAPRRLEAVGAEQGALDPRLGALPRGQPVAQPLGGNGTRP